MPPTSTVASEAAHPIWSSDSSYLLYRRSGAHSGLYVWSLRTHVARRVVSELVAGPRSISSDAWSPDGRYIAYVLSQPDGPRATSTVYLCDAITGYSWPAFSRRWIGAVTWAEGPTIRSASATPARSTASTRASISPLKSASTGRASSSVAPASPESALQRYYAALNAHDFAAAFALLDKPDHYGFTRFAGGFADTLSDTILTTWPAPRGGQVQGASFVCMGFAFAAHRRDGAVVRYGGWYALRRTTTTDPDTSSWRIAVSHSHIVEGGHAVTPAPSLCR